MASRRHSPSSRRGFSILEILLAMAILMAGVIAIAGFFPMSLRHNRRAVDISVAAYLAQMKAEEIRRDNGAGGALIAEIRALTAPTQPVPFAFNPRFAYSLCGVSLLDPSDDPGDPGDDRGVARVIVRYAADFRPRQEILYELRFDE